MKTWQAALLNLGQNPLERIFLCTFRTSFQEDLALESKLRRPSFRYTALFLLATRVLPASPNFGQAKQGQKFVVPTFHIHFLNPECTRILWVLAPKNFPMGICKPDVS